MTRSRLPTSLLWLALLGAWASSAPAGAAEGVRVMTYNIRLDLASDGVNAWAHRRSWVAAQIEWLRPDIVGLQEVLPNQREHLTADLPRYRWTGKGRDTGGEGEASPLGFIDARFELLEDGTFWLSATPDVSSRAWDAAHPRVVTWARLRLRDSAQVLLVVNTHWDHIGLLARRQSAAQILRWLEARTSRCEPVVLLGDFNSTRNSAQIRALTRQPPGLRDARDASLSRPFGPSGTFNRFTPAAVAPEAIDHIFVGPGIEVRRHAVFAQVIDGRVPSDHFPVLADLELAACP